MTKYYISLDGCDDSTGFEIELTDEEYELVDKISDMSHENSRYGCMPTMDVSKVEQ